MPNKVSQETLDQLKLLRDAAEEAQRGARAARAKATAYQALLQQTAIDCGAPDNAILKDDGDWMEPAPVQQPSGFMPMAGFGR
jgi:hypothetical protein